jgi:hypothetical protein
VVTSIVPGGFDSYARILHPVQLPSDRDPLVRWSDVSKWSGVALHPGVQWHEVALPEVRPPTEAPWRSQGPRQGSLYRLDAEALVEDLAPHTSTPDDCDFCVWSGYGGGVNVVADPPDADPVTLARRSRPPLLVELPWREYELFEGPLKGALDFQRSSWIDYQSPNLWWPADHSWCVASEIDLPWTYVGGSKELIADLLADERLETEVAYRDDPHWMDLPSWLLERIEVAAEQVVLTGSVVLTLAVGTVEVSLQPLGKRGRALIVTRSTRPYGWGSSNSPVKVRYPEELRREVRTCSRAAVLALVGA